jgi:hypothetical protein
MFNLLKHLTACSKPTRTQRIGEPNASPTRSGGRFNRGSELGKRPCRASYRDEQRS